MLDTVSLRVAFALVAFTLMVLFYVITYRSGRSAFAGWWCVSLAMFLAGSSAYLMEGTEHQVWANPLGNALITLGAGCVWAGSRSLRRLALPWWCLVVAPVVVGVASVVDDPANDAWAGGGFFLAAMWLQLGLAAGELWRLLRTSVPREDVGGVSYRSSVWALGMACGGVAAFYLGRWTAFLVAGPDDSLFTSLFGSEMTTLLTTVLLATVSFTMSTLSEEQQKAALRDVAVRDGLTGLLNRTGFVDSAEQLRRRTDPDRAAGVLILADLDHFKKINDEYGHLAGDRALMAFADACRSSVRASDLVARYGGEEFVLLLMGADRARAARVTESISQELVRRARSDGVVLPTCSFGTAELDPSLDLEQVIGRADLALYRAKADGRDRTVHYTPEIASTERS